MLGRAVEAPHLVAESLVSELVDRRPGIGQVGSLPA